jgi:zinc protease
MRQIFVGLVVWLFGFGIASAFEVQEVTSPGGIKAWLVEDHAVPLIALNFSFAAGAVYDPEGKEGASQFLTGMLDEGAGDVDSQTFQRKRDELAFQMSFNSGNDFFSGSFQTLSHNRDESFDLLRQALTAPRFDAEPLERVRQQFILSIQQDGDDPQTQGLRAWMDEILPDDPYARDSDGTVETIGAMTADDLRAAHRRTFTRDVLQVAAVGDIDAETLGKVLDQVFGGLPQTAERPPVPAARLASGPKLKVIPRDIPQSVIYFGHEGLKRDDPDFIPAYVMSEILGGGGFNTRLTTEVREKRGLTYGVSFGLANMARTDLFIGLLQTRNESAGEAMEVVKSVLADMAENGPTAQELNEAKSYLTGSYVLRFTGNAAIAAQMLGLQQVGIDSGYVARRNSLIEAVTLDQVKAQARRLLHADRLIVSVVGKPVGLD